MFRLNRYKKAGRIVLGFAFLFFGFVALLTVIRQQMLSSTPQKSEPAEAKTPTVPQEAPPLTLTFAGDLMAHTVNFKMKDYNAIYEDVKTVLQTDDLSFINVETPVCDDLPMATYPQFNVHTPYLRAAFQAGFDVFSFANNHTNDKNVAGIDGTLKAIHAINNELAQPEAANRTFAYSGLKQTADEPFHVTHINYKGWNILFCSITELLNIHDSSKNRLYYSPSTQEGRKLLLEFLSQARKAYPCDLFVLGLHLNEPEYVLTVSEAKKVWFKQLGEAGIDIIWAHHPHVMQPWEFIQVERPSDDNAGSKKEQFASKEVFCMYSMGNFISGQRWNVHYDDPTFYREYTGDAVLLQLQCRKEAEHVSMSVTPLLITQYNALPNPVVKRFTPEWIQTLTTKEQTYFNQRFTLMHDYLPFDTAQE
ncbi:MAG: CapA family protein [Treponema sp.]